MAIIQCVVTDGEFGLNSIVSWSLIILVFTCGLLNIVSYFNGELGAATPSFHIFGN
jgi:hypothetical protein